MNAQAIKTKTPLKATAKPTVKVKAAAKTSVLAVKKAISPIAKKSSAKKPVKTAAKAVRQIKPDLATTKKVIVKPVPKLLPKPAAKAPAKEGKAILKTGSSKAAPPLSTPVPVKAPVLMAPPRSHPMYKKRKDARVAYASGWALIDAAVEQQRADAAFVLSDHADFDDLMATARATGARHVYTTHGDAAVLAALVRRDGIAATPL